MDSLAETESNRDDLIERLKKEIADKTVSEASANARASIYEDKERERLTGFQGESQWFMKTWLASEAAEHHVGTSLASDIAPLGVWSDEYVAKSDITSQGALAAMSFVASKGVKRLREEASKGAAASAALATSMQENEELKNDKSKLQRDCDEAMTLANDRQKGLEILQAELSRAGIMSERFDFSKLSGREVAPPEPHMVSAPAPLLETVKAEASLAAAGRRANPLEKTSDLLTSLLGRSNAGLRISNSGTTHALLGSTGEGDIASILRSK